MLISPVDVLLALVAGLLVSIQVNSNDASLRLSVNKATCPYGASSFLIQNNECISADHTTQHSAQTTDDEYGEIASEG